MENIQTIEKQLETFTNVKDKIIFLIEIKAKYEMQIASFPSNTKWWGHNPIPRQCDVLIEKYNQLLKLTSIIENAPKPFFGLLIDLNDKQLDKLFELFKNFNSEPTDRQNFDYIFGGKNKPNQFKPIEWKKSKQLLREILTGLQKEVKYNKRNPETRELSNEIERQTPMYFVDKTEKPMHLAGNKPTPSIESDMISKFLATL